MVLARTLAIPTVFLHFMTASAAGISPPLAEVDFDLRDAPEPSPVKRWFWGKGWGNNCGGNVVVTQGAPVTVTQGCDIVQQTVPLTAQVNINTVTVIATVTGGGYAYPVTMGVPLSVPEFPAQTVVNGITFNLVTQGAVITNGVVGANNDPAPLTVAGALTSTAAPVTVATAAAPASVTLAVRDYLPGGGDIEEVEALPSSASNFAAPSAEVSSGLIELASSTITASPVSATAGGDSQFNVVGAASVVDANPSDLVGVGDATILGVGPAVPVA